MKKTSAVPTIKDVALEAGVSIGTVSKVINGMPVGDFYRVKVEKAIRKLDYHVNSYAQGLKASKTGTIALLIPNLLDPFFAELTHHINRALQKRQYRMMLCITDFNFTQEQRHITMLQNNKVDGIIGLTCNPDLTVPEGIPFVSIDRTMGPGIPCVACDNFSGGQLAAEKLADLGCRNVAFLRAGSSLADEPNKRKAGFENGCLARNLKFEMLILSDSDTYAKFDMFLKEHMRHGKLSLDGIFCMTDKVACHIVKELKKMNIQVPGEVQVIGFGGSRQFGDFDYFCSTIVQPVPDMAQMCVDLLFQDAALARQQLYCFSISYTYGGTTRE